MTPEQIAKKADELRNTGIGMTNYKQFVNDILVLIRELARNMPTRKPSS